MLQFRANISFARNTFAAILKLLKYIIITVALIFGVSYGSRAQNMVLLSINFATPIAISKTFDRFSGTIAYVPSRIGKNSFKYRRKATAVNIKTADFNLEFQPGYVYSVSLPDVPLAIHCDGYLLEIGAFSVKYGAVHNHGSGIYSSQEIFIWAKVNIGALSPPGRYLATHPINVVVNYN
jgi:hypothetical protein